MRFNVLLTIDLICFKSWNLMNRWVWKITAFQKPSPTVCKIVQNFMDPLFRPSFEQHKWMKPYLKRIWGYFKSKPFVNTWMIESIPCCFHQMWCICYKINMSTWSKEIFSFVNNICIWMIIETTMHPVKCPILRSTTWHCCYDRQITSVFQNRDCFPECGDNLKWINTSCGKIR